MEYLEIPCCNRSPFRIKVRGLLHSSMSRYQKIEVYETEDFGRCILLDDVIQCCESDRHIYDSAMLCKLQRADKRLLILGGGDGNVAEMAIEAQPDIEVTIVDLDAEVVNIARTYFSQGVFGHTKLNLVIDDAFHFMKATDPESYDGIVCDLTDDPVGYDKDKFIGFYSEVFSLARVILRKNGWIAIYAGSKGFSIGHDGVIADLLGGILRNNFSETEYAEVSVPSYGEPSCFIYGIKPFSGLDVSP